MSDVIIFGIDRGEGEAVSSLHWVRREGFHHHQLPPDASVSMLDGFGALDGGAIACVAHPNGSPYLLFADGRTEFVTAATWHLAPQVFTIETKHATRETLTPETTPIHRDVSDAV